MTSSARRGAPSGPEVEFRSPTGVELLTAARLCLAAGYPSYGDEALRLRAEAGARQWVAVEGEAVLGFAQLEGCAPEAELHLVVVAPEARGRGIGRGLLETAQAALSAEGMDRVFLEVAESNEAARALYAGLGYRQVGRRASYYPNGDAALVLELSLDAAEAR